MNQLALHVNGRHIEAQLPPRTHLADFLREELHLTGTHLGCEHGVCGACTLLVDGAPARACITYAAMCGGAEILTIEGLADDPAIAALRTAFSAAHALQCGYCTPGMLVTARDIIRRLPDADDDRIRLELAGNLCRCTGYNGIVKAIRRVLDLHLNFDIATSAPLPSMPSPETAPPPPAEHRASLPTGERRLTQNLRIDITADSLWAALQNPKLIAECVPGATLTAVEGTQIRGEMAVALGPIQSRFIGSAEITYGARSGQVRGEGQDKISRTRLSAAAAFSVAPDGENAILALQISYSLRGALAQFARGPLVQAVADEVTAMVAKNLAARLRGEPPPALKRLSVPSLLAQTLWRQLKKFLGVRRDA